MKHKIPVLMSIGFAALTACSNRSDPAVKRVDLPLDAVGRLDTQTVRALDYTLREDNLEAVVDTKFTVQFGNGSVTVPLDVFYGSKVAGETGTWQVDGRGRATGAPGSSTPGFVSRLDSMPDGPISVGQEWEVVTPSDSEAMQSSNIIIQRKARYRVKEAYATSNGNVAVRIEVDGWHKAAPNSALITFQNDSGAGEILPTWTPQTKGFIDVDLTSGTLLDMKMTEQLFSDAATTDDLVGSAGSTTYCIDTSSGFTPRSDLCGWSL